MKRLHKRFRKKSRGSSQNKRGIEKFSIYLIQKHYYKQTHTSIDTILQPLKKCHTQQEHMGNEKYGKI